MFAEDKKKAMKRKEGESKFAQSRKPRREWKAEKRIKKI